MQQRAALVWFRRDLRAYDHAALHRALNAANVVYCAFIYDNNILASLPRQDRRIGFIHASVAELDAALRQLGGHLIARQGRPEQAIPALAAELGVDAVYANHDYEPQAIARDAAVARRLAADGRRFLSFKDQVMCERDEVVTASGAPYSVFTPYRNAWLKRLHAMPELLAPHPVAPASRLAPPTAPPDLPSLDALGFAPAPMPITPGMRGAAQMRDDFAQRLDQYADARDYPAVRGPSYLSVHLRFGTLSVRELVRMAWTAAGAGAQVWLSELVWREFYAMILYHHPHVVTRAFRPAYDAIVWDEADDWFDAWCEGRTGYPLVDAAMAQLNQTGYLHNRLRMVSASFLVKDLGIDWRRGEAYFAQQLNDFDLASNNGGWQWAASTGCDAQPWFRIFNPVTQSRKFDPGGRFIRRYLPALADLDDQAIHAPWLDGGPPPIVDHAAARERTLARYAVVRGR